MLKILIVEDEDFERTALKYLINKYFSDRLYVAGEAYNGKEALDYALILKPDIVLMDINMPIMDGLEASEELKRNNKDLEIVILTAYDEFQYAKKAIKCGVSDYLVKPFSDKDFISSMSAVIEKIHIRNKEFLKQQYISENLNKAIPFIEKEIITRIAFGDYYNLHEIRDSIKLLDIESVNACCLIIGNKSGYSFKEDSVTSVKNILSFLFSQVIGARFLGDMVFFIFDDKVENIILGNKMEEILKRIKIYFIEQEGIDIAIEIGPATDDITKYYNSYNSARIALRNDIQPSITLDPCYECMASLSINNEENVISSKIINEDLEGALTQAKRLLDTIFTTEEDKDLDKLKNIISQVITKIRKNVFDFMDDGERITDDMIINEINVLNSISDITNYFNIFIKSLVKDISDYKNTNNIAIVMRAKEFIDNNYMKDIRLEEVAKYVCISSYYFSRIFKKYEGVNYIQYLTKVRMERAKELIIKDRLPIKEISLEVGYVDQNYFSRAFKKYTGESPKEFSLKYKKHK